MKNNKTETVIIEENGTGLPWLGCINSVNYRICRGVPVDVPAAVAEVIRNGRHVRRTSARISKAYECSAFSAGMRLNRGAAKNAEGRRGNDA